MQHPQQEAAAQAGRQVHPAVTTRERAATARRDGGFAAPPQATANNIAHCCCVCVHAPPCFAHLLRACGAHLLAANPSVWHLIRLITQCVSVHMNDRNKLKPLGCSLLPVMLASWRNMCAASAFFECPILGAPPLRRFLPMGHTLHPASLIISLLSYIHFVVPALQSV